MESPTYIVHWERVSMPGEKLSCSGLTARVFLARLIKALRSSGPIVIKAVTKETNSDLL